MSKYGQFCPVAKTLDVIGDRWTLLIVRNLLCGMTHFNDLERGLPGISRALLARRLRRLQEAGVIEKRSGSTGRTASALAMATRCASPPESFLAERSARWRMLNRSRVFITRLLIRLRAIPRIFRPDATLSKTVASNKSGS